MADYYWNIKSDLNNIEHDNQERENFYHSSYIPKGFISAIRLLNDYLVLVYSIMLFLKTFSLIVIAKIVFLNKHTNIWFKYELRGFYDFTLRNIAIGQYHIYRKQMKKNAFFSKNDS